MNKFFRYLEYTGLALLIIIMLLLGVTRLVNPWIRGHQADVEHYISQKLGMAVTIGDMKAGWSDLRPVVHLLNLQVIQVSTQPVSIIPAISVQNSSNISVIPSFPSNEKKITTIHVDDLSVGMNLWSSLWHQRFQPRCIASKVKMTMQTMEGTTTLMMENLFARLGFNADDDTQKGNLIFEVQNILLDDPALFSHIIPFSTVSGHVIWQKNASGWQLDMAPLLIQNDYIYADTTLHASWQNGFSDTVIQMEAPFTLTDIAAIKQYMPDKVIKEKLRLWLHRSVIGADSVVGKVILQGNLQDFPFDEPCVGANCTKGLFLIDSEWKNFTLAFRPDWPAGKHMDAHIVFRNRDLYGEIHNGMIDKLPLKDINVKIPGLGLKQETLDIQGHIQSNLANARSLILNSALQESLVAFKTMEVIGPAAFDVHIQIPLYPENNFNQVNGRVVFSKDQFTLTKWWGLNFTGLNGWLNFNQSGIVDSQLDARLFKYPTHLRLHTLFDNKTPEPTPKATMVDVKGTLGMDAVAKIFPFLSFMQGSSPYQAQLTLMPNNTPKSLSSYDTLSLKSNLKGITMYLPEPFGKKAADIKPLSLFWKFSLADSSLTIDYTKQLNIKLDYERKQDTHRFKQGNVVFKSDAVVGKMKIPSSTQSAEGVQVHFDHLYLPSSEGNKHSNQHLSSAPVFSLQPDDIPPITLDISDLRYGKSNLGEVLLKTQPDMKNHQLVIKKLTLQSTSYYLNMTGYWASVFSSQKNSNTTRMITTLDGHLESNNLEKTFTEWGMVPVIQGKKGNVDFQLNWPNSPMNFDPAHLDGSADLKLTNGVITHLDKSTEAKIGLGRLMSLLSLQNIARHLSLNFSDLSNKGLNFDSVKGSFAINRGNLTTQDTALDGPVAYIGIKGGIQLAQETYNLVLNIVPHATSSIPIVATIVGGPIVGLAALAVNTLVNQGMKKVSMYTYSVTGPWKNPTVVAK